jgi:hypothetical protein
VDDDGAHSNVGIFVELPVADEVDGEPDPEESFTALVICRVSVERTTTSEGLRVAINRPSGLGLQWGDAVMSKD